MEYVTLAVIIRRAAELDLPELLKIEEECFGAEKFSPEVVRAFVVRTDTFVLMAIDEYQVVGSAMCMISEEASEGKIASIAVLKRLRGQGIGAQLLEACEDMFRLHNLDRYTLEVETANEPAISLYENRGYQMRGIITDFYSTGKDAYCMEKNVGSQ